MGVSFSCSEVTPVVALGVALAIISFLVVCSSQSYKSQSLWCSPFMGFSPCAKSSGQLADNRAVK